FFSNWRLIMLLVKRIESYCLILLVLLEKSKMKEANRNSTVPQFVLRIEMVQKKSIMYYQQQQSHLFLKIVVALPTI
ncbi:hypothetical protein IFM89_015602, partial [Coptis chinensis]